MTVDIDKVSKGVDLIIKLEIVALLLLGIGALLAIYGHKDEGELVIGGALAIFRGKQSQ